MTDHDDSRRLFVAGGVAAVASAALIAEATAQAGLKINDPNVVHEIEAEFAGYDRALGANDVAALNGYFFDSSVTIRFGIAENLNGFQDIQAYRASVVPPGQGAGPKRERTVISTYGNDFATVSTLSRPSRPGRITRTMQTWVRLPQGWRIVAAHVSTIDEPTK